MKEVIFISGINGSGASYLTEYLVKNHPEVEIHGNVRWHSGINLKNLENVKHKITIHESDLLDLPSIIRIFRKIKPTKIFSMASHANVRVAFDSPVAVLNNNINLMINLLEATRLECPDAVFQQCSTSEIYGLSKYSPMDENHPISPTNTYAVSKLTQEALCWAYSKSWNLKIIISRSFAYINPKRRDIFSTSFAYQIARIEAGKQDVLRHGNLNSLRQLMDVRTMARAYWMASNQCEYGIPYNISGTDIISVEDFLKLLIKNAKCPIITHQDSSLLRPTDTDKQLADSNRFNDLTGFKPEYTLEESVQWLLDCCRKDVANERN